MGRLDLKAGHVEKPIMGQKWDTITHFWTAPVVVAAAAAATAALVVVAVVVANIVEWLL